MQLTKIMTSFHNCSRKWICQFDRNLDIYSFAFLSGTTAFESNILYFGKVSDIPDTLPDIHLTLVCIADIPLSDSFVSKNLSSMNLIILDDSTEQMDILRILTQLFGDAARVSSGRAHLIDALHSNRGLQSIIDTAYLILENPIIVVDSSYKLLAMYNDDTAFYGRQDLEEQRTLGYMLKSNIDAMNRAHIYEQARAKGYPYYNKDKDAAYGWITALVYIHGIEVGQIGVMDSRHSFTDVDFEIVDFLCKIVSLELQKSDFYRTNQGLMHSYLLSDLLDNEVHDGAAIEQRMANLGWDMNNNLYIMLLTDSARNFFDGKAQIITRQLHDIMPNSRWVIYHGHIVFLIRAENISLFSENGMLIHYLSINKLQAAISNRFDNIIDMKQYYKQALKAFEFGRKLSPEKQIYFYSDYIFYHMGEIAAEQLDIHCFYHPGVIAVSEYDKTHGTNFLETLRLYLTYIDNPGKIAEELYIHKNTVFYRINKLKEKFKLQLDNGDECFKMHMTIKLMELD